MARIKKYTREQIVEAITDKFGSIEDYASIYKTSKQNISQKALIQSPKFIKQLEKDGITSIIDNSVKFSVKSGRDSIVGGSGADIEELRKQLAKAEGKADTYKELYEQALVKIKELEKGKK